MTNHRRTLRQHGKDGFTLIEALTALGIFLMIVVPLFAMAFRNTQTGHARDLFVSACLLEQESALVQAAPEAWVPSKLRTVNGIRWTILCTTSGDELREYRISTQKAGVRVGEIALLVNVDRAVGGLR